MIHRTTCKQVAGFQQFIQDPEVDVIIMSPLEDDRLGAGPEGCQGRRQTRHSFGPPHRWL
jgi:hypothetical protein